MGLALLVVLETLGPAERLAFVLHDMFGVPFDEIAASWTARPAATRQLASRARRRVQGAAPVPDADLAGQRRVVDAFFAAARDGDFEALVAVLDPDVVSRGDGGPGASAVARGAREVAARALTFARALALRPAGARQRRRRASSWPRAASRSRSWASRSWAGGSSRSTRSPIPSACARWTWPCSTTDARQGAAAGARSTARCTHARQLGQRARVDVVGAVVLVVGHVGARRRSSASRAAARELDADDRVAAPVGDPRPAGPGRSRSALQPSTVGDEAAHGHDPGRRRAPGAEPEGVGHHRALREAAEDRALPRHAGELAGSSRCSERVGGVEGVGVGVADARHDVPVAAARRQERAARRA